MTLSATISNHQLCFQKYPAAFLPFYPDVSSASLPHIHFLIRDQDSGKDVRVYVEEAALRNIGLSVGALKAVKSNPEELTNYLKGAYYTLGRLKKAAPIAAPYLSPEHLSFFRENIALANRTISSRLIEWQQPIEREHICKTPGVPGLYFDYTDTHPEIFINLKGTSQLGQGTYGKIRRVLRLTAPEGQITLVAKKVLNDSANESNVLAFEREISILREFRNQDGVISMISGGRFGKKLAMFLPIYQCDFVSFFLKPFALTEEETFEVVEQLLQGLVAIAEKGVHGDLSLGNCLLKRDEATGNIKAVIADFNSFCKTGEETDNDITTHCVAPPEYYTQDKVLAKQDVWSLGIIIFQMYCSIELPNWKLDRAEMQKWTSQLKPGWIFQYPVFEETPSFVRELLNEMLHPYPEERPPAETVVRRFMAGRAVYLVTREETLENKSPEFGEAELNKLLQKLQLSSKRKSSKYRRKRHR